MNWPLYLTLVIASLVVQGFYSMMEMACVSFNKVRLHYYKEKGYRRAKWLGFLLSHPGRMFGTTLIAVNTMLQFGSESARQLYVSLGLNPDWSAISQVFIVLIFAELSPMFAARKHSEHVCMLGIPLLFLTSLILSPIIWFVDMFCRLLNKIFGAHISSALFLTRDELQKAIESREESPELSGDFDTASAQIFSLKAKTAKELMEPLDMVEMASISTTVDGVQKQLKGRYVDYLPTFNKTLRNIVGIIYPRDLLRANAADTLQSHMRPPWFVSENISALELLSQFRTNNQTLAIVLDLSGLAVGILRLEGIIDAIFGSLDSAFPNEERGKIFIERTFSGDTLIEEINEKLHIHLPTDGADTISDLIIQILDHPPAKGETVRIDHFELSVQEASLLGAKTVLLRTVN